MFIKIRHMTRYAYGDIGRFAVQRLNLTAVNNNAQSVVEWSVECPGIENAAHYIDGFGNHIHLVSQTDPRDGITFVAHGAVETADTGGVIGKTGEVANPVVFLRSTPITEVADNLQDLAESVAADHADPIDCMHGLMARIADRVVYEIDSTHAATTASDALMAKRGVCQDHAHIFISAARHLKLPARYVTGYLCMDAEAAADAHHAWAEIWLPDLGWVGFDVANRTCPTDHYVRLGCGFDARSAAPISGTRLGGAGELLSVEVVVEQQQQ